MSSLPRCWITTDDPLAAAERVRDPYGLVVDGDDPTAALPPEPFDLSGAHVLVAATLSEETSIEPLLVAASRGASLVVRVMLTGRDRARRLDELGRMATLVAVPDDTADAAPELSAEQLRLLSLIARGMGLDDAAAQMGIGRRTAYRRLAAAQEALGAHSKVEAVQLARRAGLLRDGPSSHSK